MSKSTSLGIASIIAAALTAGAFGDVLWSQPSLNNVGGLSSQDARNPGGLGWFSEVADNFEGVNGWIVNEVQFWGGYVQPASSPGNTEGFTIRVYADDNGHPGARIFEQDVFTFVETVYYTNPSGLVGYEYSVDLSPAFTVPANGQFWVSVVAILARGGGVSEPQWGWVDAASVTPPFAHQWFFDPGNFAEKTDDVGFVLLGSTGGAALGDMNCDGALNGADIDPFFLALGDPAGYMTQFPNCDIMNGDVNGDGAVNGADIDVFFECLGAGACP